jgi:hypothetical protein
VPVGRIEERAALEQGADAVSTPQSAQFHEQFVVAFAKRLKENARETRATVSELAGGAITLMAIEGRRELIVCCAFGTTSLPFAQLSRTLDAVQGNPRSASNRRREEIFGESRQGPETHTRKT